MWRGRCFRSFWVRHGILSMFTFARGVKSKLLRTLRRSRMRFWPPRKKQMPTDAWFKLPRFRIGPSLPSFTHPHPTPPPPPPISQLSISHCYQDLTFIKISQLSRFHNCRGCPVVMNNGFFWRVIIHFSFGGICDCLWVVCEFGSFQTFKKPPLGGDSIEQKWRGP